jgi:uncharacterized membrane protein YsdA (DUF1294 family)
MAAGFYLLIVNLLAFIAFGEDKRRAQLDRRRISERSLLALAFAFGAAGAYAGQQVFRHKTRKPPFRMLLPVLLAVQATLLALYLSRG